jgi:hypothetical protein
VVVEAALLVVAGAVPVVVAVVLVAAVPVAAGAEPLFICTPPPFAGSIVALSVSWPFLISSMTSFLPMAFRSGPRLIVPVTPGRPLVAAMAALSDGPSVLPLARLSASPSVYIAS